MYCAVRQTLQHSKHQSNRRHLFLDQNVIIRLQRRKSGNKFNFQLAAYKTLNFKCIECIDKQDEHGQDNLHYTKYQARCQSTKQCFFALENSTSDKGCHRKDTLSSRHYDKTHCTKGSAKSNLQGPQESTFFQTLSRPKKVFSSDRKDTASQLYFNYLLTGW